MHRNLRAQALIGLFLLIFATELPSPASGAEVDPIGLLRAAADAVEQAESAQARLTAETTLVRDTKTDTLSDAYSFRTAPGGRFEFFVVDGEGSPSAAGFRVASTGDVTLTHLVAARRHMLEADNDGFAAFVRSPLAQRIGSGLGGLAIALLSPAATSDLIERVTESEYVGIEEASGQSLHRARYVLAEGLTFDAWFAAEGPGLVQRVRPDVLQTPSGQQMAARYEKFDYRLEFRFNDWAVAPDASNTEIRVEEPSDSFLVGSLFARPVEKPHMLVGEAAPLSVFKTPDGDRLDLSERIGKRIVMLEFWQTTCPICVQAMPALEELHTELADRGLDYYAVNVGESAGDVAAFLEARGLKPTALLDESSEFADAYDVSGIPLIVLIGLDGRVHVARTGFDPSTTGTLAEQVDALLSGKDVAAAELAKHAAANAERVRERERLRGLLDS